MDATFIYLMVVLKLPIAALLYIVWYAVQATPEAADQHVDGEDGDGGSKVVLHPRPPMPPAPARPRRGPHRGPSPASPPRTRTVVARGRRHPTPKTP